MSQPTQLMVAVDAVTPAATLRAAASYLSRYGWVQGCLYDPSAMVFTPAACLVGALGMVCYGGPVDAPALNHEDPGWQDFDEALTFLDDYLSSHRYGTNAYAFNDAKGRTVEQVLAVLAEAAEAWDHAQAAPDEVWPLWLACDCYAQRVFEVGHRRPCRYVPPGGAA